MFIFFIDIKINVIKFKALNQNSIKSWIYNLWIEKYKMILFSYNIKDK